MLETIREVGDRLNARGARRRSQRHGSVADLGPVDGLIIEGLLRAPKIRPSLCNLAICSAESTGNSPEGAST